jgi:hypothetical protein
MLVLLFDFKRVPVEQVLKSSTGASCVPALGFDPQPSVDFQHVKTVSCDGGHEYDSKFPTATTYSNDIHLPLSTDYDTFKMHMEEGIIMAPGFGRA